jgi:NhaP-type Na+/H+ or K+/H+ antiporter
MYENMSYLALFVFAYSLIAGRLERTPVNGPVIYLLFGLVGGPVVLGFLDLHVGTEGILILAELTLALVLFIDASNADLASLRRHIKMPGRMLGVGLPLTIILGIIAGKLIFPELGFFEIAILATMLAPTDAALGKAVVANPAVPSSVREGLNAESGLNDGICVPILFTFLALAAESDVTQSGTALAMRLVGEQIGIGLAVGLPLAILGGRGLGYATKNGWIPHAWRGIPLVALAFASFCLAQFLGGSGFISCFVGGLLFGHVTREEKHEYIESSESTAEAFSVLTWVVFGAGVMFQHSGIVDWRAVTYAVLSLTVIRMLPVVLSLTGIGLDLKSKLFLGWFGPRGLASIVFIIIVAEEKLPGSPQLIGTVVATVVLSVLAHGLSANPLATRFGATQGSGSE